MRAAFVLVAMGVLGATARADVALLAPNGSGRLSAGRVVALSIEGLPEGVDEVELFLVPAPGARPLRLTRSTERAALLEVALPNVELPGAALALRVGENGVERWAAESAPLALHASPLLPPAIVDERHGEEWLVAEDSAPDAGVRSAPDGRLEDGAGTEPAAGERADDAALPRETEPVHEVTACRAAPGPRGGMPPRDAFRVPLRD